MYPLKFDNIYYKKIWGGKELGKFRANLPEGDIGESWDICSRSDSVSVVSNGIYKGKTINELIEKEGTELLGLELCSKPFPMLVKLINAREKLSIQVHPSCNYAGNFDKDQGKSEFWYIMDCDPDSYVILGGCCIKDKFINIINKESVSAEEVEGCLNKLSVKPGDVFCVQGGLVHAIGKGIVLAEIQDNCDITYRLYDYGRGRELHLKKAIEAVDFGLSGIRMDDSNCIESQSMSITIHNISGIIPFESQMERFHTLTCVQGGGMLKYNGGSTEVNYGESILIPAALGKYEANGNMKLIKVDLK